VSSASGSQIAANPSGRRNLRPQLHEGREAHDELSCSSFEVTGVKRRGHHVM
jgi:hypothetical protein